MAVEIKPTSVIKARLGIDTNGKAIKFFVSECAKAMDKYVPMREGNLRDYEIQGDLIVYHMPYARYQYEGISKYGKPLNYSKDKHPLATHHWDKVMWSAEGNNLTQELQQFIDKGA